MINIFYFEVHDFDRRKKPDIINEEEGKCYPDKVLFSENIGSMRTLQLRNRNTGTPYKNLHVPVLNGSYVATVYSLDKNVNEN